MPVAVGRCECLFPEKKTKKMKKRIKSRKTGNAAASGPGNTNGYAACVKKEISQRGNRAGAAIAKESNQIGHSQMTKRRKKNRKTKRKNPPEEKVA